MTREEFFSAALSCPYCPPQAAQVPSNALIAHRQLVHKASLPHWDPARDEALIETARQLHFERTIQLGQEVTIRWKAGAHAYEDVGIVVVIGAGFFRARPRRFDPNDVRVRVPAWGFPDWEINNCIRPVWESYPGHEHATKK